MASDEESEESEFLSALNASLDVQVKEKLFTVFFAYTTSKFRQKLIFSQAEHLIANNKHRSTAILCITVKLAISNSQGKRKAVRNSRGSK